MFKVIVKDSLRTTNKIEHHMLSLEDATHLAIKMVETGVEAFIKEEDELWKMMYPNY